jgi:AraC family transcriptional regulator of adaptative response / DNA-3-methyladenine glycosylase II
MTIDHETCYRALAARDVRFDGLFFVGVTSTGIYCRPVCTARTPGRARCRFFPVAALAEREGFRPCLRCRPELAPGLAPVDAVAMLARQAAARIESGALNDDAGLEELAGELGISTRQLRRAVRQEFGVSPIELAQTNRLLLAKQLLVDSALPIIEVALASGFSSVRRFNALFRRHYGFPPSRLRKSNTFRKPADTFRLTLAYRPPLAWPELLRFLSDRATAGVELVSNAAYARTVAVGEQRGWLRVEQAAGRNALTVELSTSLSSVLPPVLSRLRHLFDLRARPDVIDLQLSHDSRLAESIRRTPGLRLPGAFCGFELAVRAILGQQVSVAAATTLAGRLAIQFGTRIEPPHPGLCRIAPCAQQLAQVDPDELTRLGILKSRATAICVLARGVMQRKIELEPGTDAEKVLEQLVEIPGIGDWTAQYIAMRALHWPDAFPVGDLGLVRGSGMTSAVALRKRADTWRPWRAYAAMHLWHPEKPM